MQSGFVSRLLNRKRYFRSLVALSFLVFMGIPTLRAQQSLYSPEENEVIKRRTCEFWTHGLEFKWGPIPNSQFYSVHVWDIAQEAEMIIADRVTGMKFLWTTTNNCDPWAEECCRFYDANSSGTLPSNVKFNDLGDKQLFWWVENDRGVASKPIFFALERDPAGQNPAELSYKLKNSKCDDTNQSFAVVMPNQHFGDLEWGYQTLETSPNYVKSETAHAPHCRDYNVANLPTYDHDPMLSNWITFSGVTRTGDKSYVDVNLLFDYRNAESPNPGMCDAFQDSFDFRMLNSEELNKWPDELENTFCGRESDTERFLVRYFQTLPGIVAIQNDINHGNITSIGQAINTAFYEAGRLTDPGEFTYNAAWPAQGYYRDGIFCDSFSGHEWLSNMYVLRTGEMNCVSYSRFCCTVLRALGIPARTKSTVTQHNDVAIWIPNRGLSPEHDEYTIDEGQWVFFVPGDYGTPHAPGRDVNPYIPGNPYPKFGVNIVRTISYASGLEEYFNVEWSPEGEQNLAFKASSDGLVNPKALKLINVVPGLAPLNEMEFYQRMRELHPKQPAFLAHHLIPVGTDFFMYVHTVIPGQKYVAQVYKLIKNTSVYPFDIRLTAVIGGDVTMDFSTSDHIQDLRIKLGSTTMQFHAQKVSFDRDYNQLILEIESF